MNTVQVHTLKRIRLFAGLPAQELDAIAARGKVRTLRTNTVFIEQGDVASKLYLILSGRVKVYSPDAQHQETVHEVFGLGEHVGELALLGDSMRTASAMTIEDSTFLVLSRRAFLECLAGNPQIALNLDHCLDIRNVESELGRAITERCRGWTAFRHSGLPLILLIGGCTATGKSTIAAELALRLDIGRTQSTDILREVMRVLDPEHLAPELHASSYDVWRGMRGSNGTDSDQTARMIAGFNAQATRLALTIDGVLERSIHERASTIIEGIHVHPAYHLHLAQQDAVIVPVLLTISSPDKLKQHFARRSERAPSRNAERYLQNFESIWRLQTYFIEQAQCCGVATIPNIDLDQTVHQVMDVITESLIRRFSSNSGPKT